MASVILLYLPKMIPDFQFDYILTFLSRKLLHDWLCIFLLYQMAQITITVIFCHLSLLLQNRVKRNGCNNNFHHPYNEIQII